MAAELSTKTEGLLGKDEVSEVSPNQRVLLSTFGTLKCMGKNSCIWIDLKQAKVLNKKSVLDFTFKVFAKCAHVTTCFPNVFGHSLLGLLDWKCLRQALAFQLPPTFLKGSSYLGGKPGKCPNNVETCINNNPKKGPLQVITVILVIFWCTWGWPAFWNSSCTKEREARLTTEMHSWKRAFVAQHVMNCLLGVGGQGKYHVRYPHMSWYS